VTLLGVAYIVNNEFVFKFYLVVMSLCVKVLFSTHGNECLLNNLRDVFDSRLGQMDQQVRALSAGPFYREAA
jgi:hypothetical protein